ncbi:hypothetical protein BXZ70DRAFT_948307 [Cristinia sonorae]|uniref:MYND-type domain-containing protein n=1 Tax=Cristinia sonorae TaxID=1940300 RepID=A0A8K0UJX4_9AGAR|nr:hypothetical protein BXZ70DRAFT_948307 [Cristinia sonorae]
MFGFDRARPDKFRDPVLWNDSWEHDFQLYNDWQNYPAPPYWIPSAVNYYNDSTRKNILQLQLVVQEAVLLYFPLDRFALQWTQLSPLQRKNHILQALVKTCAMGSNYEFSRTWCPDITAEGLGADPKSYLSLLKTMVDGEVGKITLYPHPAVDTTVLSWYSGAGGMAITEKIKLDRTHLVATILWRVFMSFYGVDHGLLFTAQSLSKAADAQRRQQRELYSNLDSNGKAQFRNFKRLVSKMGTSYEDKNVCYGCARTMADLPPGTVLQACSGCRKVKRTIVYCSRECQKADWKQGHLGSAPHKEECGQPWNPQ